MNTNKSLEKQKKQQQQQTPMRNECGQTKSMRLKSRAFSFIEM